MHSEITVIRIHEPGSGAGGGGGGGGGVSWGQVPPPHKKNNANF